MLIVPRTGTRLEPTKVEGTVYIPDPDAGCWKDLAESPAVLHFPVIFPVILSEIDWERD